MPRFRLPRITLAGRGDGTRGEEHERLVLLAQIAGFVVVFAGIATFVLFAATNGGGSAAPPNPAVPSITDAGDAATTTETEPEGLRPLPPVPPRSTERKAVAEPRPKPATPSSGKLAPEPTSSAPAPQPGDGDQVGDPWDSCSPEGAHGITRNFHLPMVCHDGRWRVLSSGPGRPGGHDGDHGGHGGGHRGH